MKIKTIATGKNRKQLRRLALKLNSELEMTKVEKMAIAKKIAEFRTRHNLLVQLNQSAEEELNNVRENLANAVDKNIEMAKDYYNLSQEKLELENRLHLLQITIDTTDKENIKLNKIVENLNEEVKHLKEEAEKPWWKKVFKC